MATTKSGKKPFAHYARYYDLLYAGKDYAAETRFVHDRLRALQAPGPRLLELGCGTGRHAQEFTGLGWQVTGVDLSPGMITQAKRRAAQAGGARKNRPGFQVGDMSTVRCGKTFDAVISLFHVMGYQTTNTGLAASLRTAAVHLPPGGIFFFDYWFGPAVLTDPPSTRIKRFADQRIAVTRISEPAMEIARNIVNVGFDVLVEDKRTGKVHRITENHRVRYFFLPELEAHLEAAGFQVEGHGKWMGTDGLDAQSWYGWIAARRR